MKNEGPNIQIDFDFTQEPKKSEAELLEQKKKEAVDAINKKYPKAQISEYVVTLDANGNYMVGNDTLEKHAIILDDLYGDSDNSEQYKR